MTDSPARPPAMRPSAVRTALAHAPWSAQAWNDTAQVLTGGALAVVAGGLLSILAALTIGVAITVVLAVGTAFGLLSSIQLFAALQRSRIRAFASVSIATLTPPDWRGGWSKRLLAELSWVTTWRQFGYHALVILVDGIGGAVIACAWVGGALAATSGLWSGGVWDPILVLVVTTVGLLVLIAAPWMAHIVASLDVVVAVALLGPTRSDLLASRVELLTRSRADVVAAADAERRRIERDLHDGIQQRLVSLALKLGMAQTGRPLTSEELRSTLNSSHDEAKLALSELRDLVRGVYPAVLSEQGLDAALSGLVARSTIPARLHAGLSRRPPAATEAAAYFVVSESLANAAKHAGASTVDVSVRFPEEGGGLRVAVSDNGRGGAKLETGGGLWGLAQRVASLDGTLSVSSPDGGPTTIEAVFPCE